MSQDPTLNIWESDLDDAIAEHKAQEEQQALLESNDIKSVLSNDAGRRVLRRILNHCGIDRATFIPESPDRSAFLEGRRDIGIWLQTQLIEHEALYLQLLKDELYGQSSTNTDTD